MAKRDDLLQTIEAVHAASLDEARWPEALSATARLLGGNGAMLEVFAPPQRPIEFHAFGVPPAGQLDYFERDAALNPRGHVDAADIALMTRLVPHYRQAFETAMRLRRASDLSKSFEGAFDWLIDGVALLAKDGTILYANGALQAAARLNDGVSITKRTLNFAAPDARGRFAAALHAASEFGKAGASGSAFHDFAANRPSNEQPYLVSLRPLMPGKHHVNTQAIAIVFVRDPQDRRTATIRMLRAAFGLTQAEAALAQALHAGMSPADYASDRAISPNTVYTHLRRLKEKTGSKRIAELIHKLNNLQGPLRVD